MHDIIVIGGGPAGASAAILAAKAGKKTVVLDNDKGVTKRAWFENFYGIEEISGPDLIAIGKKQAVKFGAGFFDETVVKIESGEDGLKAIHSQRKRSSSRLGCSQLSQRLPVLRQSLAQSRA